MCTSTSGLRNLGWLVTSFLIACNAFGLDRESARQMAVGEVDDRMRAVVAASVVADPATIAFVQALADGAVQIAGERVIVVRDGIGTDPVTGAAVDVPDDAQEVINNNLMRSRLDIALAGLSLLSAEPQVRLDAVAVLIKAPNSALLPLLDKALLDETDPRVRDQLELARSASLLGSASPIVRLEAARALSQVKTPATQLLLNERLLEEDDPSVKLAIQSSLRAIEKTLVWGERLGVLFSGLSLGSILLLVALGLAITYGLMGVINMAHGELMMVGAYATYVVQGVFRTHFPGAFDWYLLASVPVAFLASALVGAAMERSVIRFLYGRPLETLLATWGISLVLMQLVRTLFGAQNVGVENPSWMSGGVQVMGNLSLPYNRIIIVCFAFAVLGGVAFLIAKTRLGLFVRGVTQNRPIAACMGVNTARVDTYAFALGSGIAGLAGCALSQVGNVGPDLGQGYIVDSFMVVVLGGVGQLAGTVYAAMGLGLLNKLLEGWTGAVLAKIAVLVFIIIFIQKRPQGIFAMKGRSAEA